MSAVLDALPEMLARLKLTAMRDRLDGLLDEAARGDLSLRETLALLCRAEVSHREERRIQMGASVLTIRVDRYRLREKRRSGPTKAAPTPATAGSQ